MRLIWLIDLLSHELVFIVVSKIDKAINTFEPKTEFVCIRNHKMIAFENSFKSPRLEN